MANPLALISRAVRPAHAHSFTEFTPLEYLQIDLANNYGLDKLDFADRISWAQANQAAIMDMLDDVAKGVPSEMLASADAPALFFTGALALRDTMEGKPTGYAISLDAASSGLQLLAVLSGCPQSASICGVVPTGHRADAYTHCYREMCKRIGDSEKIARSDLKRAIMTSLYSSTAVPKEVFGEGALLEAFYQTISAEAPGAWQLNKQLQQLWDPQALVHSWVLPDNFHVHVKVVAQGRTTVHFDNAPWDVIFKVNEPMEESRSISPNIVHSVDGYIVREMHRRCTFSEVDLGRVTTLLAMRAVASPLGRSQHRSQDKALLGVLAREQASGVLSARVLGLLDEANGGHLNPRQWGSLRDLVRSLPANPFPILSVHDCFRCHPNYGNDLRRQYLNVLAELAAGDLLSDLASQLMGGPVTVTGRVDLSQEILRSDYALC